MFAIRSAVPESNNPVCTKIILAISIIKILILYNTFCLNGKAYCWGSNLYRQLGNNEKEGWEELNPVPVLTDKLFIK
jgi:hypothetical protein